MIARSTHLAFDVPGHAGAQASVFYPADESGLADARLTGAVAADTTDAPWPVVVVLPGINVAPDGYRWLAVRLVEAGFCAVLYSAIGSLGPAGHGITPGLDMAALAPDVIGTRPSAVAIPPLLHALGGLADSAPPHGHLELQRVGLLGHSAGGTVALHNTRLDWVPGLGAVATFGAHTMTARAMGHGESAVVAIPAEVPIMLLAAGRDAVIDESRDRYRSLDEDDDDGDPGEHEGHDPVGRTFAEAIARDTDDSWLVELADANHFTMCHPVDETSGRSFLERDLRRDDLATRDLLARLVTAFFAETLRSEGDGVAALVDEPGVARWQRR